MLIALRMRLIANSPPNANPNRRAIRFSSIVSLRVNVSTQAERIRSPSEANAACVEDERALPTPLRNLGAIPIPCFRARGPPLPPHANSGAVKPPTSAPGSLRALSLGRGGGARARRGLPYSHNSSGTAAALNPAKSFAAIRITTTPYPQQVTGSQQATTSPKTLATT